jgi:hypothetical protein
LKLAGREMEGGIRKRRFFNPILNIKMKLKQLESEQDFHNLLMYKNFVGFFSACKL